MRPIVCRVYHYHLQLPLFRVDWVFGDPHLTCALVDCFTHRCPVLQFKGESYRFRAPRKS